MHVNRDVRVRTAAASPSILLHSSKRNNNGLGLQTYLKPATQGIVKRGSIQEDKSSLMMHTELLETSEVLKRMNNTLN